MQTEQPDATRGPVHAVTATVRSFHIRKSYMGGRFIQMVHVRGRVADVRLSRIHKADIRRGVFDTVERRGHM